MSVRIGIDVGGTFTDGILIDEHTGELEVAKVLTTPDNPSIGFMAALDRLLESWRARRIADEPDPSAEVSVSYVVHATTVVTNAVLEGKTARSALLVTQGFRDLLEIARQTRSSLYDLKFVKLAPLVPRELCFEVPERLDATGAVVRPLDEARVRAIARHLVATGIETVAVCLLHSYRNAAHEQRVAEILTEECPDLLISTSSEVAPEFREYFRASTTIINATVRPTVTRYLGEISRRVIESVGPTTVLMMQSNGGVSDLATASRKPVYMIESGPAAGVIAARAVAAMLQRNNAFSFDMGGTTAKVGLIEDGQPRVVKDYEVGAVAKSGGGSGGGYPIRTPVIDLVEIGAGGGSLAWIDEGGSLRVGPRSAGADPGPICYGRGGTQPSVTDANLVLGYLDPDYFLGGELRLDRDAAHGAIRDQIAEPMGLTVTQAAAGIVALANAAMANAFRLISVQRGYDPREFLMVAFGGAGPLHANRIAQEMNVAALAIPPTPGVYTSVGLVSTDLRHDGQVAVLRLADTLSAEQLIGWWQQLEAEGRDALAAGRDSADRVRHQRQAEVRYFGQGYELTVDVTDATVDTSWSTAVAAAFHAEHERAFGFAAKDELIEIVNLRVVTTGAIGRPSAPDTAAGVDSPSERPVQAPPASERSAADLPAGGHGRPPSGSIPPVRAKAVRSAYFEEKGGHLDTPIYERSQLPAGAQIDGPAIIEERESTTILIPGFTAVADDTGILMISRSSS